MGLAKQLSPQSLFLLPLSKPTPRKNTTFFFPLIILNCCHSSEQPRRNCACVQLKTRWISHIADEKGTHWSFCSRDRDAFWTARHWFNAQTPSLASTGFSPTQQKTSNKKFWIPPSFSGVSSTSQVWGFFLYLSISPLHMTHFSTGPQ